MIRFRHSFAAFAHLLITLGLGLGLVGSAFAAERIRIAIAPFVGTGPGDEDPLQVAQALTRRLAKRPIARLIAPDAFVAGADFDPRAAEVRQWAYNAAVDTVVVGRVLAPADSPKGVGWRVEAVLRSGHSGVEMARHSMDLDRPTDGSGDLDASVEPLVVAILETLGVPGGGEVAVEDSIRDPRSPEPPVSASREQAASSDSRAVSGGGLDADFEFVPLRSDTPIQIKADEAEIVDRGEGRKLIFQHNVVVRQDEVSLESDRLEADYRKGESEPDRLVAEGSVRVVQGHRRARCDRAVYLRLEQKIFCEGHAELIQGCDVVRGDSIEFDLADDQARVKGAASIVIRPGDSEGQACPSQEGTL